MHFKTPLKIYQYLFCSLVLFSCNQNSDFQVEYTLNPNNISPLTASLKVSSNSLGEITTLINGKIPISKVHLKESQTVEIPLIGLYPNRENIVEVIFDDGNKKMKKEIQITTEKLPIGLPRIEINKCDRSKMEKGFHACDFHLANHGKFHSLPFIFDDLGDIRWYLDLGHLKRMAGPFQKFTNGNIVVGTRTHIYQYDMLGKVVHELNMNPNYGIHHDLIEMPDTKILALVGKRGVTAKINQKEMRTDNDFTILIDQNSPTIIKEWDIAEILDVSRNDINTTRENDFVHSNSIFYNESDNSILISGKNQGVIKQTWENELKWILAPHQNWGSAGRYGKGVDTRKYLLKAVDSEQVEYSDSIQLGLVSHKDFDFPWGQHASKILPNGNLILFDNGSPRNFNNENKYSRVVEYRIDEKAMTVEQVWQYGKERGEDLYSSIVSDVDFLSETENILMTSGFLNPASKHNAKIVEIDKKTNQEVFEATLYLKSLNGERIPKWGQTDILYRSERMDLN